MLYDRFVLCATVIIFLSFSLLLFHILLCLVLSCSSPESCVVSGCESEGGSSVHRILGYPSKDMGVMLFLLVGVGVGGVTENED